MLIEDTQAVSEWKSENQASVFYFLTVYCSKKAHLYHPPKSFVIFQIFRKERKTESNWIETDG